MIDVIAVPGFSILTGAQASNNALLIVCLKPWEERKKPELQQNAILAELMAKFNAIPEAQLSVFGMPSIQGIGTTGGFSFVIEDTTGTHTDRLQEAIDLITAEARKRPEFLAVYSTFSANVPQVFLEIDREKALKLGVALTDLNTALQGLTGYTYVNDFNKYGKVYKVEIQAETNFRDSTAKLRHLSCAINPAK